MEPGEEEEEDEQDDEEESEESTKQKAKGKRQVLELIRCFCKNMLSGAQPAISHPLAAKSMPTALCEFCRKDKSKKKKQHKKEHDKKEKKKTSGIGVLTCSFQDNAVTSYWGATPT